MLRIARQILIVTLCCHADGQELFTTAHEAFPFTTYPTSIKLFIDVDGDGDDDIVTPPSPWTRDALEVQKNDGFGHFLDLAQPGSPPIPTGIEILLPLDSDNDGDLDIFATTFARSYLLLNDGTGLFTDGSNLALPTTRGTEAATVADLDGDGFQDLLLSASSGVQRLIALINQRNGTFADQTTALLPNWTSRCFDLLPGDFDNDGDTDVVASDWTAEWILVNTGGGRLILSPSTLPGTLSTLEHEASDVDGDGDLDILAITNIGVKLLENVGGAFVDRTSTHLPPQTADALAIELGDVDGDGDLDLAVTPNAITTYAALLWTNLGNGVFVDASSQLPPAPRTSRPA